MLDKEKRLIQLAILGVSIESFWLAMYLLVSLNFPSNFCKAGVVIAAGGSLVVFIDCAIALLTKKKDFILLLLILPIGYIGAFHLLGLVFFRGLLSDAKLSLEYGSSLVKIAFVLLAIYSLVVLVLCGLKAFRIGVRTRTMRTSSQ